ncbi:hypothetical protein C0J52_14842 [Blattella germanica]|nr:hypothetical protein C0J52_14842 [Blattella germanica]
MKWQINITNTGNKFRPRPANGIFKGKLSSYGRPNIYALCALFDVILANIMEKLSHIYCESHFEQSIFAEGKEASPPSESLANCLENLRTGPTTLLSLQRIKNASIVFHKRSVVSPSSGIPAQNGMRSGSPSPSAPPDYGDSLRRRKVHRCDVQGCDKVYTKSSHLKAHKRTHTDFNLINKNEESRLLQRLNQTNTCILLEIIQVDKRIPVYNKKVEAPPVEIKSSSWPKKGKKITEAAENLNLLQDKPQPIDPFCNFALETLVKNPTNARGKAARGSSRAPMS